MWRQFRRDVALLRQRQLRAELQPMRRKHALDVLRLPIPLIHPVPPLPLPAPGRAQRLSLPLAPLWPNSLSCNSRHYLASCPPAATTSPFTIVDWAYQNTANTAILAGDTGQSSSAVPETGSTALFSLGAAGLCLWRARKRARRA